MPWTTPTLRQTREQNRDYIVSRIKAPLLPNSVTRVLSDAGGGLAHGVLQYIDWLALQLMPDTAETEWLDRFGNIWLVNSDGSTGRKGAMPATGTVALSGCVPGTVIPFGTLFSVGGAVGGSVGGAQQTQVYQSTQATGVDGAGNATVQLIATTPGAASNMDPGVQLGLAALPITGIVAPASVVSLTGGTDEETDDELRVRVLQRIQEPPMGGDAADYVAWALEYPGVTRAWCSPLELGIGTVTVRFMCDDLRADGNGFPNPTDVANVQTWINSKRPVTALDTYVVAPIPEPVSFTLHNLEPDDSGTRANITASVQAMLRAKAAPAFAHDGIAQPPQTIYAAWISNAVMEAAGVAYFDLVMTDHVMPTKGSLAVLGTILID